MLDTICVYNNKIFIPHDASIISYEYSKCNGINHTQNFKESFRLNLTLPTNFHLQTVFLDVVENYSIGLKCMMVLAVSLCNEIFMFMYCGTIRNSLFQMKNLGWAPSLSINPNINLFLIDGPMLMLFTDDVFQISALSYSTKHHCDLRTISPVSNDPIKVLHCSSVGQLFLEDPINVILLFLHCGSSKDKEVFIISIGINIKQNDVPVIQKRLPTSVFFPKCFQNAVKAIHVTNANISKHSPYSMEDIRWENNCSFVCTHAECMVFFNGTLQYVTKLAFPDISYIRTEFCDLALGIINMILMSETGNAHLLSKADSFSTSCFKLQINKSWTSIKSVLSLDISLNGLTHVLLLKDTSFETWQDSCIISDISYLNPVDILSHSDESNISVSRAIPGLQAKVQRGKLTIVEAESKISKKIDATLDALFKLNDCNSAEEILDHHISSFQESLVDIILHNEENCKPERDASKHTVTFNVLNHWIRFIDNRCLLCWTLCNNDERIICNPSLSVLMQDQQVQCTQKLFVHKSHTFSFEDECRKQINPGEKFSLVVSLEIPEFRYKDIAASAILSWYVGSSSEFENEVYLSIEEKTLIQQQQILNIVLSAEDIFSTRLEDVSTSEDLVCFKVIQQRIVLSISSLHSDLGDFEKFLLSTMYGSTHLLLLESSSLKCVIFKSANLPLHGVHLIFKPQNVRTVEIEAYTKNDKEVFLLVQYLYQTLPEDILILTCGNTSAENVQLSQQSVCAMKDEVDLLLSTFNIHNVNEKINQAHSQVSIEPGTIVIPKETFLRIRKTLVKKECITDNIMQSLNSVKLSTKIV